MIPTDPEELFHFLNAEFQHRRAIDTLVRTWHWSKSTLEQLDRETLYALEKYAMGLPLD